MNFLAVQPVEFGVDRHLLLLGRASATPPHPRTHARPVGEALLYPSALLGGPYIFSAVA